MNEINFQLSRKIEQEIFINLSSDISESKENIREKIFKKLMPDSLFFSMVNFKIKIAYLEKLDKSG